MRNNSKYFNSTTISNAVHYFEQMELWGEIFTILNDRVYERMVNSRLDIGQQYSRIIAYTHFYLAENTVYFAAKGGGGGKLNRNK